MSDSRSPIVIDEHTWMYPEGRSLLMVREVISSAGVFIETQQFGIPWAKVRKAVAAHDKKKAKP